MINKLDTIIFKYPRYLKILRLEVHDRWEAGDVVLFPVERY